MSGLSPSVSESEFKPINSGIGLAKLLRERRLCSRGIITLSGVTFFLGPPPVTGIVFNALYKRDKIGSNAVFPNVEFCLSTKGSLLFSPINK